jgi:hypothetical protein
MQTSFQHIERRSSRWLDHSVYCGSATLTLYIVLVLATVPCLIWLAGFVMTWAE